MARTAWPDLPPHRPTRCEHNGLSLYGCKAVHCEMTLRNDPSAKMQPAAQVATAKVADYCCHACPRSNRFAGGKHPLSATAMPVVRLLRLSGAPVAVDHLFHGFHHLPKEAGAAIIAPALPQAGRQADRLKTARSLARWPKPV